MGIASTGDTGTLVVRTTRDLVGKLEGVAFLAQAVFILVTAVLDRVLPEGRLILLGLAAAHIALAVIAFTVGGPFYYGGGWTLLWFGFLVIVPLVAAHVIGPVEYAASPTCVQMCGYPGPATILIAFYPWIGSRHALRELVAVGMLMVVVVQPFLIVLTMYDRPSPTNYLSVGISSVSLVLGFALGKALGVVCTRAANKIDKFHFEYYKFLHTRALGVAQEIRDIYGADAADGLRQLALFEDAVQERRKEMLLDRDLVPLSTYFNQLARMYERVLRETPRVGDVEVPQATAALLDRALGDLLRNASRYGKSVWVYFEIRGNLAVLEVVDDGPGFSAAVMDDPGTNLHGVREDARAAGGDLIRLDEPSHGSRMRLTVALTPPGRWPNWRERRSRAAIAR